MPHPHKLKNDLKLFENELINKMDLYNEFDAPSNNQSQEVMSMKVQQQILKYIEAVKTTIETNYIPITFKSVS